MKARQSLKKRCQRACKPGSVLRKSAAAAIPLGDGSLRPSSNQPGRRAGTGSYAAPIRSCTRWGLPCRHCCQDRGALLPHPFDLTPPKTGGILSVALSLRGEPPAGRYPAPLFRGARTFLVTRKRPAAARPSGGVGYRRTATFRHPRENADPTKQTIWVPAFAGMTIIEVEEAAAPAASPGIRRR